MAIWGAGAALFLIAPVRASFVDVHHARLRRFGREGGPNSRRQLRHTKGLPYHPGGIELLTELRHVDVPSREEHSAHAQLPRTFSDLEPVHYRHHDVGDEKVELLVREDLERLGAATERLNRIAELLDHRRRGRAHIVIVIDEQDSRRPMPTLFFDAFRFRT